MVSRARPAFGFLEQRAVRGDPPLHDGLLSRGRHRSAAAEGSAVKILRPIAGSPADRAGIKAGDLILRIDGATWARTWQVPSSECAATAGSTVHFSVRRPGTGELLEFTMQRAHVAVHSVLSTSLEPGYGYVRITGFSETTAQDLNRAVLRR